MAGAAPSTKPAPFLKPLDIVDRGVLLAESSLSLVIVAVMVLVSVMDSGSVLLAKLVGGAAGAWITTKMLPVRIYSGDVMMQGTLWVAFFGASYATRGRKHLAIDVVGRLLPDRGRRIVAAVASTLGAVIAFGLARGIFESLQHAAHDANEQLASLQRSGASLGNVDRSYEFQFIIPGGFLLISLRLALHAFHEFLAAMAGVPAPEAPVRAVVPDAGAHAYRPGVTEAEASPIAAATAEAVDAEVRAPPPVATATGIEVGIALVAMAALLVLARGTTVLRPALVVVVLGAASLGVPLWLRWQRTRSLAPTVAEPRPVARFDWRFAIASLVAVVAIVLAARYGVDNVRKVPVGWGIAFFAVMAVLGAPLFTFLGGLALFLWLHGSVDVAPQSLANSVEDALGPHFGKMSVLPTIPVFTLAGYLMSESKTPQRLVRLARAALGWAPGGLAIVCLLTSSLFTVFSGASGITIVAIGGLLFPAMIRDKYPERFSLGLVTTGGALGITLPFCLPMIVYGIVAGLQEPAPGQERLELQKFMFSGIVPALLAVGLFILYSIIVAIVRKVPRATREVAPGLTGLALLITFFPLWVVVFVVYGIVAAIVRGLAGKQLPTVADIALKLFSNSGEGEKWEPLRETFAAFDEAKWEILVIVFLPIGLLLFGPTTAAVLTAFYVLIIEVFVYKDLSLSKDIPRIVPESMTLVGAIFVKLCAATILTAYFIQAQTADKLFEWLTCGPPAQQYMHAHATTIGTCREAVDTLARAGHSSGGMIDSKLSFLIALNVFLLVVGMLMDIFSAIVVVVPLIAGIALHFNINPYHLGVVFLFNLEIGYLMPPMGLNLFIASFRFNRPVPDLYSMVLPFIGVFILALMLTTYIPKLTLMMVPGSSNHAAATTTGPGTSRPAPTTGTTTTPAGSGATPSAPSADCDVPRDNESFEAFQARCAGGGAGAGEGAGGGGSASDPDCDAPRDNEPFPDFERRCNLNNNAAPEPGAAAPGGGESAPAADAAVASDAAATADAAAAPTPPPSNAAAPAHPPAAAAHPAPGSGAAHAP